MSDEAAAESHRASTRREFAHQAAEFERPGSLFRDAGILDWIEQHVPARAGERVLDVAGGTGALGRRLALAGELAVVADLTPEMLAEGRRAAERDGQRNVVFVEADAMRLPFADEQFDLVVTRFALHHVLDPAAALAEMARVCRPGGRVAVIDLVRESGAAGAHHDELERLRDPSHRSAFEEPELLAISRAAGVRADLLGVREAQMPAEAWLARAHTGEEARARILAALRGELEGGEATGLRPLLDAGGQLHIAHRWLIVGGERS